MNELDTDVLERILENEEEIQPMTGFSTRVMRAVREEAEAPAPMAFPWARFLPGVLLNLVLLVGAATWAVLQPGSSATLHVPTEWFADPQARGLLWATLTMVGTGLLAWIVSKMATPRRVSFL